MGRCGPVSVLRRPYFVVDPDCRIVEVSAAAASALAIDSQAATGKFCWEAMAPGEGARPDCYDVCPVRADRASRSDRALSTGPRCMALPVMGEGAIVWPIDLQPRGDASGAGLDDALVIGALAELLRGDDWHTTVERSLDLLQRALGADDAELFLADPDTGELHLVACEGADRDALMERTTFGPGCGYPGIVSARRRALATRDLRRDRRYLRHRAKEAGLRACLCVPLADATGTLGSLDLAWRRADPPLEIAGRLLARASDSLSMGLRVAFAELLRRGRVRSRDGDWDALGAWPQLHVRAGAEGGNAGALPCGRRDAGSCPTLLRGGREPSLSWSSPCAYARDSARALCCLPVVAGDEPRGVLVADYGAAAPSPATRDLVVLKLLAREIAPELPPASTASPVVAPRASGGLRGLEVRCLGPFEVRIDGAVVPAAAYARKGAPTVLKMLALAAGRRVGAHVLVDRLWPDATPEMGLNRLHGLVHALRGAIEPGGARSGFRYVLTHPDGYSFDVSAASCVDVVRYRRLTADLGRGRPADADLSERAERFDEARALYRGDLFEDDPFAEWCADERTALRERQIDLLVALSEIRLRLGDPDRALACLREALRLEPVREDLHRRTIELLVGLGRRAEALEQYHACVATLRRELGAAPMPETLRLAHALDHELHRFV